MMASPVPERTDKYHKICACKGIRTCLLCEPTDLKEIDLDEKRAVYVYCCKCCRAWPDGFGTHPDHNGESLKFEGISFYSEFVTPEEETLLYTEIDRIPFVDSQSGRRKQDYGPKVNFKKKKFNTRNFTGLPQL
ncbi:hypothetical protein ScPMuIL_006471 [Solemya velum]